MSAKSAVRSDGASMNPILSDPTRPGSSWAVGPRPERRGPRRSRSWCPSTTRRPTSRRRSAGSTATSPTRFPLTWLVTIADNASTDRTWGIACRLADELDGVQRAPPRPEGSRPGPARGVVGQHGAGASPTWTSTSRPTSTRCSPSSRRCVSGHSDVAIGTPAGARRPRWCAGRSARRSRAAYNLLLQADAAQRVLRRPVRLQGDPDRRRPRPAARWSRTRAGSSTPSCSCSPSTTGCASTRCRSTGSTIPTPGSTSSAPPSADLQRRLADGAPHRAAARCRDRRAGSAASRARRATVAGDLGSQLVRFASIGVVSTIVFARPVRAARRHRSAPCSPPSWPSACARWPTPPPTGASPSPCAVGPAGRGTTRAWPWPCCRWRSRADPARAGRRRRDVARDSVVALTVVNWSASTARFVCCGAGSSDPRTTSTADSAPPLVGCSGELAGSR